MYCIIREFQAVAGKLGVHMHKKLHDDARRSRSTGDLDQADYMLVEPTTVSRACA